MDQQSERFLRVRMDISSICNLRCKMCHFSLPGFRIGEHDMSKEVIDKIAAKLFPIAQEVFFSCSTEPMMARTFPYLLELIGQHNIPFTEFTTNATLMTSDKIDRIIDSQVASIVISIDGATKETFEQIRVGANFEEVIGNIARLYKAKTRAGSVFPDVKLNWVLMKSNISELPQYIDLAYQLGVRTLGCVHLIANSRLHVEHELLNQEKELTNLYFDLARQKARMYDMVFYCPPNFSMESSRSTSTSTTASHKLRPTTCPCPTSEIVIFPTGKVSPCGYWWSGYLGDLTAQTFDDIWFGEPYAQLRDSFKNGQLMKSCQVCPSCGRGHVDNPEAFTAAYTRL